MTYEDLKFEFSLHSDGDPWGNAMAMWFDIACELHYRHPSLVPDAWEFQPSPMQPNDPREPKSPFYEVCQEASTAALLAFGNVMYRYASRLKNAGYSY